MGSILAAIARSWGRNLHARCCGSALDQTRARPRFAPLRPVVFVRTTRRAEGDAAHPLLQFRVRRAFLYALSYSLYLHVPGFFKQLGANEVVIGLLFAVAGATAIASRPLLGWAMDARGRRDVILAGGALNVVVCALYLTVTGVGVPLFAVRMAHGVSEAMLFASLFAFVTDLLPASRRIEGIALFGVSGMLPSSLGGLLGDAILSRGTYMHLFAVSAAFSAVALALSLALRDPPRVGDQAPSRGIAAALMQPDLLPLWFLGTAFATALAAPFAFMKTFVLATAVGSVGLFYSAYAGAAVVLRIMLGSLPERLGPKRVLFPALLSLALGLTLLAVAKGGAVVAVAGILCGAGHGYVFPILLALVVARARPSERGAALAIFTALFDLGLLLGGPIFGAVVRVAGYSAMFATASATVVAGCVAFAVWDRSRPS